MHEFTYSDIVNESIKEPLLAYRYSGQDDSLLYKHVISPLCQWLVEKKTPTWLASNTITVVGMLINLLPHALIFATAVEGTPPHGTLAFLQGAGMLLYSIADNMDGKQARKIGAASPLGMIIDHGCDGISGGLIGLSVAKVMGLEHFWQALTILATIFLFFLANLEQYYTHILYLPKINAVNEGVWAMALTCILTAFLGPEIWTAQPLGIPNNKIMLISSLVILVVQTVYHTRKMLAKAEKFELLMKSKVTIAFCLLGLFLYMFNTSLKEYSYLYVIHFSVTKVTILCQIGHVTNKNFNPVRLANLAIFFLLLVILLLKLFDANVKELTVLLVLMALADFGNFCFQIVWKLAKLLGIKVFTVIPKETPASTIPEPLEEPAKQDLNGDVSLESKGSEI